jgi:hypothetical protein
MGARSLSSDLVLMDVAVSAEGRKKSRDEATQEMSRDMILAV